MSPLKSLTDLDFADDIVLLDSDTNKAEEHVKNLEREAEKVAMSQNQREGIKQNTCQT